MTPAIPSQVASLNLQEYLSPWSMLSGWHSSPPLQPRANFRCATPGTASALSACEEASFLILVAWPSPSQRCAQPQLSLVSILLFLFSKMLTNEGRPLQPNVGPALDHPRVFALLDVVFSGTSMPVARFEECLDVMG
jgi:hypothetical protein